MGSPSLVALDEPSSRTLPGIILSCLFTLLTCIAFCIRRDIPSPYDTRIRVFSTKFNILFWVLVCPEVVVLWALRQWFEAGKVAKTFHTRGWTRRHGLFLLMGGYILCKDGQPLQTLSEQRMMRLVDQGAISFPSITITELKERGNLHPTFALVTFLQASWFITECFSRLIDGLLITQLEVLTLSHVFINLLTLIFTWQKPLNARYPIPMDTKLTLDVLSLRERRILPFPSVKDDFKREQNLAQRIIEDILQVQIKPPQPRPQVHHRRPISIIATIPELIPRGLRHIVIWPIKSLYLDCGRLLMNPESSDLPQGSLKVPLFYVPGDSIDMRTFLLPITTLGLGIGIVSYLLLYRTHFPSETLRLTWRIASIASTMFCAVLLGLIILVNLFQVLSRFSDTADTISDLFLVIAICTFFVGFLPFVMARITLLVASLACLRSLPREAFGFQPWTNYIPHFT